MDHPDETVISETGSICPVCFAALPASVIRRGDSVFLRKVCARHGRFRTLLWRGEPAYETWFRPKIPLRSQDAATPVKNGCPFDCGLCTDHRQQTCTALIEVTSLCNLSCAFCFADSGSSGGRDPDLPEIRGKYASLQSRGYVSNIQLSGGEPTMRDDLPEIIAMGRSMGFEFIQLNTNGLRLASEPDYPERLREAGLSSIFLQFDGSEDTIYKALRGGDFFDAKVRAIHNCRQAELGVVLVPTLVPGVNLHDVGRIISFAVDNVSTVRGVHFQPVAYMGRYPKIPADNDRITLPDVMRAIEVHTRSLIRVENFQPPGCENARCSFHGSFVVMPDGGLKALTLRRDETCSCSAEKAEVGAARTRQCVAEHWSAAKTTAADLAPGDVSMGGWDLLLERARTHRLSVSGMAFQDAWNLDLERLKDCCIHVIGTEGRLVPFCAYNLTGLDGLSLYRRN